MRIFFVFLVVSLLALPTLCLAEDRVLESWDVPVNRLVFYSNDGTGTFNVPAHKVSVLETCGQSCRWHESLQWRALPEEFDPAFIYRVKVFGAVYSGDSIAPEVGIQIKDADSPYEVRDEDRVYWEGDICLNLSPDASSPHDALSFLFAAQTGDYSFDRIVLEKIDTVEAASLRGDCDGDGRLTQADAACILQILSGMRR